ncbi:flavin-containing monooxygenase [Lysinimonas soli]|uniref:Flavin-containing monooxygenase n=1 Tax=Lysinimonas soli TaxID=1074233 RepID=A0ABW0NKJ2_9MICO
MSSGTLPIGALTTSVDAREVAGAWLERFERAMTGRNAAEIGELVLPDGWWRDLLTTGWDFRSIHGAAEIAKLVASSERIGYHSLDLDPDIAPRIEQLDPEGECIVAFIRVTTEVGVGRGILRLRPDGDSWRAWVIMTALQDLTGHEQARGARRPFRPSGADVDARVNWLDARRRKEEFLDGSPEVVVIGSGHGGLMTAAHLGFWGVDTLVIERNNRVGDNWRNRYRSLVLHDAIWADHLPGLAFPDSWPVYTPKDKLGDWLEFYASALELNVWTGSVVASADYDDATGRWTIVVRRSDGSTRTVFPAHVVMATGIHGTPRIPDLPGLDAFRGPIVHSSTYTGEEAVDGIRALVIGAGNSAHDVAQDLVRRGLDVTMVQRSSTYVISQKNNFELMIGKLYREGGMPTDDADLLGSSFPYLLALQRSVGQTEVATELDRDLLDGLDRAGYRTDSGIAGGGGLSKILYGPGGYYIDVGCAQMIAEGRIAITHSEVTGLTERGVEFADGTSAEYDIIVMATGYTSPRETARAILGSEVDRTGPVWGLDESGELRGIWRPTGHPGFWFMGGPLYIARTYSRYLALQVHASIRGIRPLET